MADFIPEPLRRRLGDERADRLAELVCVVERELRHVYEMDSRAFDPTVGDNSQLFGLGIWHHGWFFIDQVLEDWPEALVTHEDNSHRIRVFGLTLAVYKGGDLVEESIYEVNFNGSATKKQYARENQLRLFPLESVERPEDETAFDLTELWLVHFGNPREGFVKLYIGAPTFDELDRPCWAWYRRVDEGGPGGGGGERVPDEPEPYDARPEPGLDLELHDEPGAEEADAAGGE
jgi:hypothetical protein